MQFHYAGFIQLSVIMLSIVMQDVFMLSVIMLSIVMKYVFKLNVFISSVIKLSDVCYVS
jgi:hypothetical protein